MMEGLKAKRLEDLQFIEKGNYTDDESDMAISPSAYNVMNQRFRDISDVQIYLNSMGEKMPKDALEQLKLLESSLDQDEDGFNDDEVPKGSYDGNGTSSYDDKSGSKSRGSKNDARVVPYNGSSEKKKRSANSKKRRRSPL